MRRSAGFLVPLAVLITFLFFIPKRPEVAGLLAVGAALVVGLFDAGNQIGLARDYQYFCRHGPGLARYRHYHRTCWNHHRRSRTHEPRLLADIYLAQRRPVEHYPAAYSDRDRQYGARTKFADDCGLYSVRRLGRAGLDQGGILPISAHLFIFYFGMFSTITPPVCLAAYTAASLAKTDPMKTGWECMRLGVLAYIVPFIFAVSPAFFNRSMAGSVRPR